MKKEENRKRRERQEKKKVEVKKGRVRKRIEVSERDSGQQFFDLAASETAQSEKGNRKSAGEQSTKTNDILLSLVLSSIQTPLILILLTHLLVGNCLAQTTTTMMTLRLSVSTFPSGGGIHDMSGSGPDLRTKRLYP